MHVRGRTLHRITYLESMFRCVYSAQAELFVCPFFDLTNCRRWSKGMSLGLILVIHSYFDAGAAVYVQAGMLFDARFLQSIIHIKRLIRILHPNPDFLIFWQF